MKCKFSSLYPVVSSRVARSRSVSSAGGVLLVETIRATGLDRLLQEALSPWMRVGAVHHPGKILLDVALAVGLGGDCLADIGVVRCAPDVFGRVASDPVVSRLFTTLGKEPDKAVAAVQDALSKARATAWRLAGGHAPHNRATVRDPLVIDLDATLITSHSDKEGANKTFKKGWGHHPLCAFADHGPGGSGEPLVIMLRDGNAGSNTAADHIRVTEAALSGLPVPVCDTIMIRADGAGGTKQFVTCLHDMGVQYSVGFTLPMDMPQLYHRMPTQCWTPALDSENDIRDGADVAEFTGLLDLAGWPKGMRVIVRRERPHPGAQLRFDDVDGYRLTAFATNTRIGQHQRLELVHRRRGRCEDRIRCAKDTGLRNLPLQEMGKNMMWCVIIQIACCLIAWTQLLGLRGTQAAVWEPKRLRLRLFSCPADMIRTARQRILRFNHTHPWAQLIAHAINRIRNHTHTKAQPA